MTTTDVKSESKPELRSSKLGEELPVFCERCGYSLHGLPQTRCEHCTLLQFHCPECGHHQPINTLRPAAQTILGRIRGGWLALIILFKLNLIGWTLFGWCGMGAVWSYHYDQNAIQAAQQQQQQGGIGINWSNFRRPRPIDLESALAFGLYGLAFGLVLRMALLKWRRGWAVGIVLACLVMGCIMLGVWIEYFDRRNVEFPSAYTSDFLTLMAMAFTCIVLGAAVSFAIWTLLVHAFLPKRTAHALLNWQRSLSNEVSSLAREKIEGERLNAADRS